MMAIMFSSLLQRALVSLGVLLGGCAAPATQIIVVVDSDLEPGVELTAIEASVSVGARLATTHRFDLAAGAVALPFSFGVAAPAGAVGDEVRVSLHAEGAEGQPLVTWRASTGFREHRTLRLDAPLARACTAAESVCGDELTCERGTCRDERVDAQALAEIDPAAAPPRLFDGPSAAVDGGVAAEPCVEGTSCETESPCVPGSLRCGAAGDRVCEPGAPKPAGTDCGEGRACDAEGRCGITSEA